MVRGLHGSHLASLLRLGRRYNVSRGPRHDVHATSCLDMEKKVFWLSLALFSLIADFTLPFIWAVLATLPIVVLSWWIAYRSGWF